MYRTTNPGSKTVKTGRGTDCVIACDTRKQKTKGQNKASHKILK